MNAQPEIDPEIGDVLSNSVPLGTRAKPDVGRRESGGGRQRARGAMERGTQGVAGGERHSSSKVDYGRANEINACLLLFVYFVCVLSTSFSMISNFFSQRSTMYECMHRG
eukprot:COSAG01_NODE_25756_length_734_cov_1.568504_2_plen_110_part_00